MTVLTNDEILKCVLGGAVLFEGYKQYADSRPYEFHIRIRGANAHKMTAHMIALNEQRVEDDKKREQEAIDKANAPFKSEYQRKQVS